MTRVRARTAGRKEREPMPPTRLPGSHARVLAAATLCGVLLLAACSYGDERQPEQAADTVVARFAPGGEVSVVTVSVLDRRPLRSAELVGPGGVIVPAASIDTDSSSEQDRVFSPAIAGGGLLGTGGGFGFGTGGGVPMPLTGAEAQFNQQDISGQLHSVALLRLPDPLGYRLEWQQWQVRVHIGDPPHASVITLPAPQPPANL
jgi:hypothetical protein